MIKTVQIRNLILGDKNPAICVPIVAEDQEALEASLALLKNVPFDLAEFRADHLACLYANGSLAEEYAALLERPLHMLRAALGDRPLLFTVRTLQEGGKADLSYPDYEALLLQAAGTGLVDLVDLELFTAGEQAAALTEKLHHRGVKVIGSSHDFTHTPGREDMLERLLRMQDAGMDITKLAVMPVCRQDVIRFLSVACEMADEKADRPFVVISMGPMGNVSRISGTLTGSAFTFASAGRASAPGQIPAEQMRQILDVLDVSDVETCSSEAGKRSAYQITGTTRLGGLLGSPVAHSKSPLMHNESFRLLGLDHVYLCFDMGPEKLGRTVQTLRDMNTYGFNLTMPLKTAVIPYLDELSEEAALIGAVNTVKNDNGRLIGYNTDGMGFMASVREQGMDVSGRTVTLLGAGGAASAISVQAALDGAAVLHLVSRRGRSWEKAGSLVRSISENTACRADLTDLADEAALAACLAESDLLINATSVGMAPDTNVSPIKDPSILPPGLLVGDVIYHPERTLLLKQAAERGCRTFNGMDMLLYQGAAGFKIWTGMEMPVERIREMYF